MSPSKEEERKVVGYRLVDTPFRVRNCVLLRIDSDEICDQIKVETVRRKD